MSRIADEKNGRSSKGGKSKAAPKAKKYMSFHPTKEEKQWIREDERPLEDVLEDLRFFLVGGCKITIGHSENTGAVYASIREQTDDWQNARSYSGWHSDPGTALRCLVFGLLHYQPKFPEMDTQNLEIDFEW